QYYLMENMIVAGSQYWNQVHGSDPEQVKSDAEGLQTMRTLAQNMTWLLQSIKSGRENGVEAPHYEDKTFTNFIR
ncbi:MAG: flavodoxin family protein, partial [Ruminococcus sp.]|nr:flavodoxin family protein [Ruminococcus sp.]